MATNGKTALDLGDEDDEDFCFTGDGAGSAEDNAFDEVRATYNPRRRRELAFRLIQAFYTSVLTYSILF